MRRGFCTLVLHLVMINSTHTHTHSQGELADYINAQVSESQTKKTLDTLKNKVQGLAVSHVMLM